MTCGYKKVTAAFFMVDNEGQFVILRWRNAVTL
jgi:hypothetical protein